jgi:hypothetical protein
LILIISKKVLPVWSGAATTKPQLARCVVRKVDWWRRPELPWEKATSG